MTRNIQFYLLWTFINPIGFILGSLQGATSDGVIPTLIPGKAGLILGDLVFGMIVGFSQWLVLRKTKFPEMSAGWIFATSISFMIGARVGAALTFRITDNWQLAAIIFGFIMGGCIGFFTAFTLPGAFTPLRIVQWILISVISWVVGESIAFLTLFSQQHVLLVAFAIACIKGIGLIYLYPQNTSERQLLKQSKAN